MVERGRAVIFGQRKPSLALVQAVTLVIGKFVVQLAERQSLSQRDVGHHAWVAALPSAGVKTNRHGRTNLSGQRLRVTRLPAAHPPFELVEPSLYAVVLLRPIIGGAKIPRNLLPHRRAKRPDLLTPLRRLDDLLRSKRDQHTERYNAEFPLDSDPAVWR